jgi:hypothetical protein
MKQTSFQRFIEGLNHVGFNMNEKVAMIANNEVEIDEVVNLALSHNHPQARFCCWIMVHYLDEVDNNAVNEYIDRVIDFIPLTKHTGQRRDLMRWLSISNLQTEKLGQLLDLCLETIMNHTLPIAVKIHAMTVVDRIAKNEPEIIPEFAAILTDILPYTTVGGDNKINKLLAKYKKQGFIV